jgi:hypothetical protein
MKGKLVQNGGMNERSERARIAETSLPGENVFRLRAPLGGENLNGERRSIRGSVFGMAAGPTPPTQHRPENEYEETEKSPFKKLNSGKHRTRIPKEFQRPDPAPDHRWSKNQLRSLEMIHRLSSRQKRLSYQMHPLGMGTKEEVIKGDAKRQRSPFEDGKYWENTRDDATFPTYSHGLSNFIPLFPTLSRPTIRGFPRFPTGQQEYQ